ncbi:MAG: inositol monophosphatase family protein [Pirellulaceae bacterium]
MTLSPTSAEQFQLQRRYLAAVDFARKAGQSTLKHLRPDLHVECKSDNSPVTIADREAEQILREHVLAAFPDDSILGEEFGAVTGTSEYRWVVDPIDGTKSFIAGVPLYGTIVGVQHRRQNVIGVVYIPGLDEIVHACIGQGAWHQVGSHAAQAARVSDCVELQDAIFVTSQRDNFDRRDAREKFFQLEAAAWVTRTWGDCYGYVLVATGRADLMVDPLMNQWDAVGIEPILREAGGVFADWQGGTDRFTQIEGFPGEGVGTNARLLPQVTAILGAGGPAPSR